MNWRGRCLGGSLHVDTLKRATHCLVRLEAFKSTHNDLYSSGSETLYQTAYRAPQHLWRRAPRQVSTAAQGRSASGDGNSLNHARHWSLVKRAQQRLRGSYACLVLVI